MKTPLVRGGVTSLEVRRDKIRLALLLATAGALAFLGNIGAAVEISTLRPVFQTVQSLRQGLQGLTEDRVRLTEELERERSARLLAEHARARDAAELIALREKLGLGAPDTGAWRLVRVLGVIPSRTQREVVIDRGVEAGVAAGAAVVAQTKYGLAFVGRVVYSSNGTARVLALTDPSSSLPVTIHGHGSGLLFQGGFPGQLGRLLYLPTVSRPKHYDEVRLAQISPAGGMLVGWVWEKEGPLQEIGTGLFSSIQVLPAVDPATLDYAWVEISG